MWKKDDSVIPVIPREGVERQPRLKHQSQDHPVIPREGVESLEGLKGLVDLLRKRRDPERGS